MITFREQVQLVVYFCLFGMFLAAMYDILNYYLRKMNVKLIVGYCIQFVFWLGLVFLSCAYVFKVSGGYLTIYTFGFFLFGILFHFYFLSEGFSIDISRVDKWICKSYKKIRKVLIILVFPREVFWVIRKLIPNKKTFQIIIVKLKKIIPKKDKEELDIDKE